MKLTHQKRQHAPKKFFTLDDLSYVASFVRLANEDHLMTSHDIADALCDEFYDLSAVPVQYLTHDGIVETSHWVNLTSDNMYVIDATGDRFSYIDPAKYKNQVTPWIYKHYPWAPKRYRNILYFSSNHMPCSNITSSLPNLTDVGIARGTRSIYNKGLRCICIAAGNRHRRYS